MPLYCVSLFCLNYELRAVHCNCNWLVSSGPLAPLLLSPSFSFVPAIFHCRVASTCLSQHPVFWHADMLLQFLADSLEDSIAAVTALSREQALVCIALLAATQEDLDRVGQESAATAGAAGIRAAQASPRSSSEASYGSAESSAAPSTALYPQSSLASPSVQQLETARAMVCGWKDCSRAKRRALLRFLAVLLSLCYK